MEDYTVLFVDDEPFILTSLSRLFRGDKMRILTASSGEEALKLVMEQSIQVVVTDNIMPGMSGVELARRIKECSPDTIRILLSGQSDMEAVLRAINEGEAYKFVMKPWYDMDLKATVHLALAQYRLMEQNRELIMEVQEQRLILNRLRKHYPDIYLKLQAPTVEKTADLNASSLPVKS